MILKDVKIKNKSQNKCQLIFSHFFLILKCSKKISKLNVLQKYQKYKKISKILEVLNCTTKNIKNIKINIKNIKNYESYLSLVVSKRISPLKALAMRFKKLVSKASSDMASRGMKRRPAPPPPTAALTQTRRFPAE